MRGEKGERGKGGDEEQAFTTSTTTGPRASTVPHAPNAHPHPLCVREAISSISERDGPQGSEQVACRTRIWVSE